MPPAPRRKTSAGRTAGRQGRRGQALVEYLMMSLMLLFLFTGMYRMLTSELHKTFERAGMAILTAYY